MRDERVFDTGADPNDVLEGAEEVNRGLRVRVRTRQPRGIGGPIRGQFVLLEGGTGKYGELIASFKGASFATAKQFLESVKTQAGGKRCTHILNCNLLRRAAS